MERIDPDALHFFTSTYYVMGYSPLALPLGELSPQVTERDPAAFFRMIRSICVHTPRKSLSISRLENRRISTKRHQELRTFRIISKPLRFIMLRAIQFNDQSGRSTVKVHDESADNPLFVNFYWIFAEKRYQSLRSWGVISLRSRRAFSNWVLSFGIVMVCPLRPRYARPPLPKGEARMLARYTERCIEVCPYQFSKLEFTARYGSI